MRFPTMNIMQHQNSQNLSMGGHLVTAGQQPTSMQQQNHQQQQQQAQQPPPPQPQHPGMPVSSGIQQSVVASMPVVSSHQLSQVPPKQTQAYQLPQVSQTPISSGGPPPASTPP